VTPLTGRLAFSPITAPLREIVVGCIAGQPGV